MMAGCLSQVPVDCHPAWRRSGARVNAADSRHKSAVKEATSHTIKWRPQRPLVDVYIEGWGVDARFQNVTYCSI